MTAAALPNGTPLLTIAEVAERLRVTRHTVHRIVNNGGLRVVKLSARALRIPAEDVDRFVRDHMERRGESAKDYRRAEAWS